ncbi:MAG: hypothetical protein M1825_006104 [Sarcosagium campestre]|nr:MAG: hypothetical protein M1825_006104 [Sarcosagium campestre]
MAPPTLLGLALIVLISPISDVIVAGPVQSVPYKIFCPAYGQDSPLPRVYQQTKAWFRDLEPVTREQRCQGHTPDSSSINAGCHCVGHLMECRPHYAGEMADEGRRRQTFAYYHMAPFCKEMCDCISPTDYEKQRELEELRANLKSFRPAMSTSDILDSSDVSENGDDDAKSTSLRPSTPPPSSPPPPALPPSTGSSPPSTGSSLTSKKTNDDDVGQSGRTLSDGPTLGEDAVDELDDSDYEFIDRWDSDAEPDSSRFVQSGVQAVGPPVDDAPKKGTWYT